MTISRPARPRWPGMLAAGVAGILVGLAIGLAVGGDEDPDPLQGLRDARSSLQRAAQVLDIVTVEYAEGVEGGQVASEPEYRGAVRAIQRSRELYGKARPVLAYVDAELPTRIDQDFRQLARQAAARAPEQDVQTAAGELAGTLEGAIIPAG